jgi:hypothetical protein
MWPRGSSAPVTSKFGERFGSIAAKRIGDRVPKVNNHLARYEPMCNRAGLHYTLVNLFLLEPVHEET